MANWTYDGQNGPDQWTKLYAMEISGKKQSPVDFNDECCQFLTKDSEINSLVLDYPENFESLELTNVGLSWKVEIPSSYANSTSLTGGPLKNNYKLAQFHCHWGQDCTCGSEHTVDGKSYAAELHFVHWNSDLYASFSEAMKQPNGLAVIGVFLDANNVVSDENNSGVENQINGNGLNSFEFNEEIDNLSKLMEKIPFKGQSTIIDNINIKKMLPKNLSYFSYEGSLTTPPLYESVNWIVFKTPVSVSEEQISKFRQLYTHRESETPENGPNKILFNFRPIQPICERSVNFIEV